MSSSYYHGDDDDVELTSHVAELCTVLKKRMRRVSVANDAEAIAQALIRRLSGAVGDILCEWNNENSVWHMPLEILACCCRFLGFRDRLAVSQVARSWRHSTLHYQKLWSDITLSAYMKGAEHLLGLALRRSGESALTVSFSNRVSADLVTPMPSSVLLDMSHADAAVDVLAPHMHRVRSLVWCRSLDWPCFLQPAPMLEEFYYEESWPIPVQLFGGIPGRLRILSIPTLRLPASCPALSTLAMLTSRLPMHEEEATHVPRLFEMCPVLEELSLAGMTWTCAHWLPEGPAPLTLTRLTIVDYESYGSAAALFTRWRTERLKHVHIKAFGLLNEGVPSALFEGALELAVRHTLSTSTAEFVARTETGASHTLEITWYKEELDDRPILQLACFFGDEERSFRRVHTLSIPIDLLAQDTVCVMSFPALAHLRILIESFGTPSPNGFARSWNALPMGASAFLRRHPLRSLELSFDPPPERPEDLHEFLFSVSTGFQLNARGSGRTVIVRGLPASYVAKPACLGPDVDFCAQEHGAGISYCPVQGRV